MQRDEKDSTPALFICFFLQTVNGTLRPPARHSILTDLSIF